MPRLKNVIPILAQQLLQDVLHLRIQFGISEIDTTFDNVGALKISQLVSSSLNKPLGHASSTYPVPRLHMRSLIR